MGNKIFYAKEKLAEELYEKGLLKEAYKNLIEMGKLAELSNETKKFSDKYFDRALEIKREIDVQNKPFGAENNLSYNRFFVILALAASLFGILLLTPNFTGSAILDPSIDITNWIGFIFISMGFVLTIWLFVRKR